MTRKGKEQLECVGCGGLTWRKRPVCAKCHDEMIAMIECMRAEGYEIKRKDNA